MENNKLKRVLLAGGGTMGSVSPLFAIVENLKLTNPNLSVLLVGTSTGPEGLAAKKNSINFKSVYTAKLRRYWSWQNFLAPILFFGALLQSVSLIVIFKPSLVIGAGGFVQVPIVIVAWIFRIPILIHQQDVDPTLSNILCAPLASKITVTFQHSIKDFYQGLGLFYHKASKVVWTGNPVSEKLFHVSHDEAIKYFHLSSGLPVLLIVGGSSGASGINRLIGASLHKLVEFTEVIHGTGPTDKIDFKHQNYHQFDYIERMDLAYKASMLVVSRAGLSSISELSALGKPSIIIPMPDSHQEYNAAILWAKQAAVVIDQKTTEPQEFIQEVRKILLSGEKQKELSTNISMLMPEKSAEKIVTVINEMLIK